MLKRLLLALAALALTASPALAQRQYPTAPDNVSPAPGVVPLQCTAAGASCAPQSGDVNGTSVTNGVSSTRWFYTSGVSPILSNTTTAVTIKAAAGAGIKNVIDACQITTTAFGASVPLVLRDGAGGTVKFALTVPAAGFLQPVQISLPSPLVGTANTLWEVATPTANTSGTVTFNCQGHTEQ